MALSSTSLSSAILGNLCASGFTNSPQNQAMCDAIANAIVQEISSNAEVAVTAGSSAGSYKVS